MLKSVLMLVALGLAAPAWAQTKDHTHSHAQAKGTAAQGYFEDSEVADRPLSDWAGDWQSVWPYLESGKLDPVMEAKAKKGSKTAAEYRAYYETGYKTDLSRLTIEGDRVTFWRGDKAVSGLYTSDGYEILTYAKGNRGVRFIFRKTEGDAEAPGFMQFSDHIISPQTSDHFHIYLGDDRTALLSELTHWPTYYPAKMTGDQILHEMLEH